MSERLIYIFSCLSQEYGSGVYRSPSYNECHMMTTEGKNELLPTWTFFRFLDWELFQALLIVHWEFLVALTWDVKTGFARDAT